MACERPGGCEVPPSLRPRPSVFLWKVRVGRVVDGKLPVIPVADGLSGAGRWDAPVRAHYNQRRWCSLSTQSFTNLSDSRVKTEMAKADGGAPAAL